MTSEQLMKRVWSWREMGMAVHQETGARKVRDSLRMMYSEASRESGEM